MSNLYIGPSIDASYQVSVHLAKRFQRKRLICEKLMDNGRRTPSDLTLPLGKYNVDNKIEKKSYEHENIGISFRMKYTSCVNSVLHSQKLSIYSEQFN